MLSQGSMLRARAPAAATRASRVPVVTRRSLHVVAFGPQGHGSSTKTAEKQEKEKGFINEMRKVAMKLHTREQAPKEGEAASKPQPRAWAPTREGYLRFLVESKAVYEVLEKAVADKGHPEYAAFTETGLERSKALAEDIAWYTSTYGMEAPTPAVDGPGQAYASKIAELAASDPQAFICHYYNFYFAHTAGGKMIGAKVSEMLLDSHPLKFYQYDGEVMPLLDGVRKNINSLAESWTPEQKSHCLEETSESFKYSGAIMQCITMTE